MPKNTATRKLLIVEADSDKQFVQRFLKERLDLNLNVQVVTPPDINPSQNYTTQGAVFNELSMILKQLADGEVTQLGILIDMDYQQDKPVPIKEATIERLAQILMVEKFVISSQGNHDQGIFFSSIDFDHPVGVWLMPNNHDEGYLESWITQSMSNQSQLQLQRVEKFIDTFEEGYFKPHVMDKAKVYTWLATQRKPTQDLSHCLSPKYDLLDENTPSYQNFRNWLLTTFS